jgi:translation elongation factor EF-1alpha
MRNKLVAMVLALMMAVSTVGCRHNSNTVIPEPPAVVFERNLLAAADATVVIASGLETVNEVRLQLVANGDITPEQSANILAALKSVAIKNQAAVHAIALAQVAGDGVDTNWRKALIDVVAEARKIDPSVFAIKNQNAQATFQLALATLQATLVAVDAAFGGK